MIVQIILSYRLGKQRKKSIVSVLTKKKIPMCLLLNLNGDVRFVPLKSAYDSIKRAVTEIEAECSVETSFVTNMDLRVEIKIL